MRPEALFTVPWIEQPVIDEVLFDPAGKRFLRIRRALVVAGGYTITYNELSAAMGWDPTFTVTKTKRDFLGQFGGLTLESVCVMSNAAWASVACWFESGAVDEFSREELMRAVKDRVVVMDWDPTAIDQFLRKA